MNIRKVENRCFGTPDYAPNGLFTKVHLLRYDDKPTALAAGAEYRKTISRDAGLLSLIEAEFDENNQMIGTSYKLHEVIR